MKSLKLKIDNRVYDWHEQYITGAELKQLGNIPTEELLFLAIKKPWEDELIENDTNVNLARPSIEHFYSKKEDDSLPFIILVNTRDKEWNKRKIKYEEVVLLAFPNDNGNSNITYTVTYSDGPKQNPEGSMVKGQKVFVTNKMKFNVTATNKS